MEIELKPIDRTNYNDCIKLKLHENQQRFIASNIVSLVQAAYEPNLFPLGVYYNNIMVGFILYDLDSELNAWSMSRFMIDINYQNKGIGTHALKAFLEFFINKYGHIPLYTSAEVENYTAISLYEKMGFRCKEPFEYEVDGKRYKEIRMLLQL